MLDVKIVSVDLPNNPNFDDSSGIGTSCVNVQVMTSTWFGSRTKYTKTWCCDNYTVFSNLHDSARIRVRLSSPQGKVIKSKPVSIDKHVAQQRITCPLPNGTEVHMDLVVAGDDMQQPAGKRSWWSMLMLPFPSSLKTRSETGPTSIRELTTDSHVSVTSSSQTSNVLPPYLSMSRDPSSDSAPTTKRQRLSKSGKLGWRAMFSRSSREGRYSIDRPGSHGVKPEPGSEHTKPKDQSQEEALPQDLEFHKESQQTDPAATSEPSPEPSSNPGTDASHRGQHEAAQVDKTLPAPPKPEGCPESLVRSRASARFALLCLNPLYRDNSAASSPRTPNASALPSPATVQPQGREGVGSSDPGPVDPARVQQAMQLLAKFEAVMPEAWRSALKEALDELAGNSHEGISADPSWGHAVLDSVMVQLQAYDVGTPDADGFYTRTVHPRSQGDAAAPGPLVLRMVIADTDQAALGAKNACTCISMLLAQSVLQGGPEGEACVLDAEHIRTMVVQGAELWHELCADEDIAASHASGMLDFETVVQHVPGVADRIEVHSVIGCQASTLPRAVAECVTEPGPYTVTVAGHTTCAVLMRDGRLAWANSLGGALAPGATVCLFDSAAAWAGAVVALNMPGGDDPGSTVAVEMHGLQKEGAGKVPVQFCGFFP